MIKFKAVTPFQAKYPLYALRAYEDIKEFEEFILISSKYREYILDCPSLEGDYASRRTQLLGMKDLEFKVYPLRERFTSISQLVNSKRRWFIDAEGTIVRYKPSKFYHIKYAKVLRADRTWNGYYRLMTNLPVAFVTEQVAEYVGYIQVGSAFYLYELSHRRKATTRKKL
ncbi:hypothetical protein FDJ19_gp054 [Vibrio phage Ceto]|uniref:Uncharacterized protein n=1 Tax=Vibrio phage Ceto TaxID=2570300 RepID=A0A2H5BGF5_9CAUD|nr:hypothetical protein FDJ19_gp054 [Vibrio phage Ceto]AUG85061.1 hypothetical protein CETO_54 [Vibrio phage Ceto]